MEKKYVFFIGGGCCCIITIISAFLIGFSFRIIEVDQYGILYNTHAKSLKNETYESGRKFAGLGKQFRKFSLALHTVEFTSDSLLTKNVACWTKDGVSIYISIGYFYRVIKNQVYSLYMTYGTEDEYIWQLPLIRATETAIKEATTRHNATEFFEDRLIIKEDILFQINKQVSDTLDNSIEIIDLQLRAIDIDENFESSIIDKLIQYQKLRTYQIEQEAAKILKQTELIEAYAASNITQIQAEATAKGNIILAQARADVFSATLINEAKQYSLFKNALGQEMIIFNYFQNLISNNYKDLCILMKQGNISQMELYQIPNKL